MRKLFCFIFISLFIPTLLLSQELSVQSFNLEEKDMTASTQGTMVTDYNGQPCALIKVKTVQKGFTFDGGIQGIISIVEHPDEIWVYVPDGMKRIGIYHPQLGALKDDLYWMPIHIEAGKTYIMKLTNGQPEVSDDGNIVNDSTIEEEGKEAHIQADLINAIRFYKLEEYELCLAFLEEPVRAGNGLAQVITGMLCYTGKGVEQDYDKAYTYFGLAALQKTPEAYAPLAMCYYYGHGVEKNEGMAYFTLLLGIDTGNEQAIKLKKELFGDE